jgi:hypothetical protein
MWLYIGWVCKHMHVKSVCAEADTTCAEADAHVQFCGQMMSRFLAQRLMHGSASPVHHWNENVGIGGIKKVTMFFVSFFSFEILLYSPTWPRTCGSPSCLGLLSTGITGVHHHTWLGCMVCVVCRWSWGRSMSGVGKWLCLWWSNYVSVWEWITDYGRTCVGRCV